KPAVDAIRPPETLHDFVWTAGGDGPREHVDDVWEVLWMNRVSHSPLAQLLDRLTEVLDELGVDDFHLAACRQEGDHARDAVEDHARLALAFLKLVVAPFAFDRDARDVGKAGDEI